MLLSWNPMNPVATHLLVSHPMKGPITVLIMTLSFLKDSSWRDMLKGTNIQVKIIPQDRQTFTLSTASLISTNIRPGKFIEVTWIKWYINASSLLDTKSKWLVLGIKVLVIMWWTSLISINRVLAIKSPIPSTSSLSNTQLRPVLLLASLSSTMPWKETTIIYSRVMFVKVLSTPLIVEVIPPEILLRFP